MDLSLTESQTLIQDSAKSFVRRHAPRAELVRQAKSGETWNPAVVRAISRSRVDRRPDTEPPSAVWISIR